MWQGNCCRHGNEVANKVVLWMPTDGKTNKGTKKKTYVET